MSYLIGQILGFLLVAVGFGLFLGWNFGRLAGRSEASARRRAQEQVESLRREAATAVERSAGFATRVGELEAQLEIRGKNSLSRVTRLEAEKEELERLLSAGGAAPKPHREKRPTSPRRVPAPEEDPVEAIPGVGRRFGRRLRDAGIATTAQLRAVCADDDRRRALSLASDFDEGGLLSWAAIAELLQLPGITEAEAELLESAGFRSVRALLKAGPPEVVRRAAEVNERLRLTASPPTEARVGEWIRNGSPSHNGGPSSEGLERG